MFKLVAGRLRTRLLIALRQSLFQPRLVGWRWLVAADLQSAFGGGQPGLALECRTAAQLDAAPSFCLRQFDHGERHVGIVVAGAQALAQVLEGQRLLAVAEIVFVVVADKVAFLQCERDCDSWRRGQRQGQLSRHRLRGVCGRSVVRVGTPRGRSVHRVGFRGHRGSQGGRGPSGAASLAPGPDRAW